MTGARSTLAPLEAKVLHTIADSDKPILARNLIELIWPNANTEPDYAEGMIRVLVYRLRKQGVRIHNNFGFGYTLHDR